MHFSRWILGAILLLGCVGCRKPPVGNPEGTFQEYRKAVHLEAVAEGQVSTETQDLAEAVKSLENKE